MYTLQVSTSESARFVSLHVIDVPESGIISRLPNRDEVAGELCLFRNGESKKTLTGQGALLLRQQAPGH